jgi:hypothetical protein
MDTKGKTMKNNRLILIISCALFTNISATNPTITPGANLIVTKPIDFFNVYAKPFVSQAAAGIVSTLLPFGLYTLDLIGSETNCTLSLMGSFTSYVAVACAFKNRNPPTLIAGFASGFITAMAIINHMQPPPTIILDF